MKTTNIELIELRAEEGMLLVGTDGYGAKVLYLGIYDSPGNYIEISEEDYVEPEKPEHEQYEEIDFIQMIIDEEANKDEYR